MRASSQDWESLSDSKQENIKVLWHDHFMAGRQLDLLRAKVDEWAKDLDSIVDDGSDETEKFTGVGEDYNVDLSQPYSDQDLPLNTNRTIFLLEATRLVHNYCAASYSLDEYASALKEKVIPEYKEECTRKAEQLNFEAVNDVVIRLRACLSHTAPNIGLPSATGREQGELAEGKMEFSHTFAIDRAVLDSYLDDDPPFLHNLETESGGRTLIDVVELFELHYDLATEFYFDWFMDKILESDDGGNSS